MHHNFSKLEANMYLEAQTKVSPILLVWSSNTILRKPLLDIHCIHKQCHASDTHFRLLMISEVSAHICISDSYRPPLALIVSVINVPTQNWNLTSLRTHLLQLDKHPHPKKIRFCSTNHNLPHEAFGTSEKKCLYHGWHNQDKPKP